MKSNRIIFLLATVLLTLPATAQTTDLLAGVGGYEASASGENPNAIADELDLNGVNSELDLKDASRKTLKIIVDKADHRKGDPETAQTLQIYQNGTFIFETKVSTGREKNESSTNGTEYFSDTPEGTYSITRRFEHYESKQWNAPMPYAQFFVRGIAIHATTKSHYDELGTRASGGCVRVTLEDAKYIYELVNQIGATDVSITVYDSSKTGALKPFDLKKYSPHKLYDVNGDGLLIY